MIRFLQNTIVAVLALLTVSSCSLMHDDLPECDTGCYVHFVYDYNVLKSDLFSQQVGDIGVYVYDSLGNFVMQEVAYNDAANGDNPLAAQGFTMHLDLQPGRYRLACLATQRRIVDLWETGRTAFRWDNPSEAGGIGDVAISLDRNNGLVDASTPLDTLWTGIEAPTIEVRDLEATHDTIHLMRITKKITVRIHDADATRASAGYSETITAENGTVNFIGKTLDDECITYQPNDTVNSIDDDGDATSSCDFTTSRLMLYDTDAETSAKGARLVIRDNATGKALVDESLTPILAKGNEAYAAEGWGDQEYLDRDHEYVIDFYVKHDTWEYVTVSVKVLNWTKRIQNLNF